MASSSSSSNMALPRANGSKYDVFLSFRGEDTRHSFTDHLYNALKQAGILTFRDIDDAERGEELKEEIEKAIKASDASIIVLSENYAASTWCLDELSLILDQRRDCNHFVLPIFYNVDSSNVGKQKGTFKIQADPSKPRWTDDNVKRWKAALTEVVGVSGMTLVGSETKFIREVVDTIYNRLDRKQIHIPANITGMDVRYEEINSLLKQSEAQFLVICGMAGSGKSTMAQYIVYSEGQQFESNSIVEKIGSRCKNSHEMVVLQEQLCSDISKGKQDRRIDTVCKGTAHIEVLLEKTKALIVLDEIVDERHLEELLGSGNINKESKIIITTNNDISNWFMSKSMRFQKYIMRLLNDDEALELLSLHAFRSKLPKDGYTELAQQVVRYCGGNPLALEVLGSSLSKNDTITSWKSELNSFEKSFDDRMYEAFIRSYNSLPSSSEKELFLHIACFFVGSDMNHVVKILEPDYGAESKIKTLTRRCFLYVTPDNKLMMHRLLQEMGRSLVDRESRIISERTRVWRNKDSYEILRRKKRSNTIEGLALDIRTLIKEDGFESRHLKELSTDSLQRMDQLKLLQLKFVKLTGSYKDSSEHLRWLYWVGFNESTVPTGIYMGNMVALDLSYSYLKEFEPPMYLPSLKILNLKDSHKLSEIRKFREIPNLETLILWNCHNLLHVCRTIGNLERLALLNTAGCENLFNRVDLPFPLPRSLQRVFLNDCNLDCTDYFPLSFSDQSFLQYINLANGHFEILPSYNLLKNLRVLDLRKCSRLKRLLCLPSTLAELFIYDCKSIEKITFESGQFTLQEFGYEGCVILSEVEDWFKLLLITKLDESDLGHMNWLKEYQYEEVCLVGDYELTKGRSCHLQMLYEFNIMSTSLPDIKHPKLTTEYTSQSTSLSFDVPLCPRRCRIKGLNVTFRYTMSGDDWVWFVKIRTTNNVDLMYNPKVFGKPGSDNIGKWLSYWPIGNLLDVGDVVYVSIVVMSGLEVLECGASVVYTNDDVARDAMENKTGWVEAFGEDLYRFKLRNGSYYLCQRDIYKLTQVGRLTPGWLSMLAGYTIDDTDVRGWRMTGRPQQSYQSFIELKTIRCIIHGPDTYHLDVSQGDDSGIQFQQINDPYDYHLDVSQGDDSGIQFQQINDPYDYHTDVSQGDDSEIQFQQINVAYDGYDDLGEGVGVMDAEEVNCSTNILIEVEEKRFTWFKSVWRWVKTPWISRSKDRKPRLPKNQHFTSGEIPSISGIEGVTFQLKYTYSEVQSITGSFKTIIGKGGFGTVFHGSIGDNQVAVKMFSDSSVQRYKEFQAEVRLLMSVHHKNITSLIGYCDEGSKKGIIYEFMANGNLGMHLFDGSPNVMSWKQRVQIGYEAAQGLEYLHHGCNPAIVHRDVKCSNILLNEKFQAKLADFSLSIAFTSEDDTDISTEIVGTFGYIDPEYYTTYRLTVKSDVYSFGVVLLELITGRPAISPTISENRHIVSWVKSILDEGKMESIIDPRLQGDFDINTAWKVVELAMACVQLKSVNRPTMDDVVMDLKIWLRNLYI